MKITDQQKVDNLAESAIETIRERAKYGEAPILMVFSGPDITECRAIAAEGLDAKALIEELANSPFSSRFQ